MPLQKVDRIWMDGELVPWDQARVHVLTHSLHYGSGVFEGIRAYATDRGGMYLTFPGQSSLRVPGGLGLKAAEVRVP